MVIDTLSFSTSAVTAVHHGGIVYPCAKNEDPIAFAKRAKASAAVARQDVPEKGLYSLSPLTFLHLEPNTRLVLSSPNGATCSHYASDVPYLLIGTLINAKAVAEKLTHLLETTEHILTLLSCGERWTEPNADGELRWALEDDLGAGAILSYLAGDKSPEAMAAEGSFYQLENQLSSALVDCASGRELAAKGFESDVRHAAKLNLYASVPMMYNDHLKEFR